MNRYTSQDDRAVIRTLSNSLDSAQKGIEQATEIVQKVIAQTAAQRKAAADAAEIRDMYKAMAADGKVIIAQDGNLRLTNEKEQPNRIPGREAQRQASGRPQTEAEKDMDYWLQQARAHIAKGGGKAVAWNGTEDELRVAQALKAAAKSKANAPAEEAAHREQVAKGAEQREAQIRSNAEMDEYLSDSKPHDSLDSYLSGAK